MKITFRQTFIFRRQFIHFMSTTISFTIYHYSRPPEELSSSARRNKFHRSLFPVVLYPHIISGRIINCFIEALKSLESSTRFHPLFVICGDLLWSLKCREITDFELLNPNLHPFPKFPSYLGTRSVGATRTILTKCGGVDGGEKVGTCTVPIFFLSFLMPKA